MICGMRQSVRDFLKAHPLLLAPLIAIHCRKMGRPYGCRIRLSEDGKAFAVRKGNRELRVALSSSNYLPDAMERFDYYLEAIIPDIVKGREVAYFDEPRLHSVRGVDGQFLFTSFPEGLETAEVYLKGFPVRPGEVVIDAGAYCGLTAHLFAKSAGATGSVIAIEADPRNYSALLSNLERHPAANITPLHAAVWKE